MHIVVCIKQVPDTQSVKLDPEHNTLIREGVDAIVNPFDMYAIEEAIRLRDQLGGQVTAISMGPPQAEAALREAIAMGVDQAILLSDIAFAGSDTWATSYILSQAIKKLDPAPALVLFGKQAADGDTAQVGPGVAANLDWPQITYVRKIEEISDENIIAERMLESGYEVIESSMPCALTVVKEINEPRLPSLKGKMAARKATIPTWSATDIDADPAKTGLNGSPTRVVKIFSPPPRQGGEILEGEPQDIAQQLVSKLKDVILEVAS